MDCVYSIHNTVYTQTKLYDTYTVNLFRNMVTNETLAPLACKKTQCSYVLYPIIVTKHTENECSKST